MVKAYAFENALATSPDARASREIPRSGIESGAPVSGHGAPTLVGASEELRPMSKTSVGFCEGFQTHMPR